MNSKNILFLVLFCLSCPLLPLWSMQGIQDPFDIKEEIPEIKWVNNFDIEAKIIPYNNNVQRYLDIIKDKEGSILVKEKYQTFLKNHINPILGNCYSLKQRIDSAETIDELFHIYLVEGLDFNKSFFIYPAHVHKIFRRIFAVFRYSS